MTITKTLYNSFQRYRTLQTHRVQSLPIAVLMPHSACNCRCVMCDIWKGNKNLKQLTEEDINGLLTSFRQLGTQQVLMSGGEALLNPHFFRFCELLRNNNIKITLLTAGLTIEKHAGQILEYVNELILSLDGDAALHNYIRNIPEAFETIKRGACLLKELNPAFRITVRSVIHKINYRKWPAIIEAAKEMRADQVSFLPADVSSHAFNREILWNEERRQEVLPDESELPGLKAVLQALIKDYHADFESGFIAESPGKLEKLYNYYAAFYGHNPFPYKKCNAPWVSAVIEADGTVRPCFFHAPMGNIRQSDLKTILNKEENIRFRKQLNVMDDATCEKCVCYLNLSPLSRLK